MFFGKIKDSDNEWGFDISQSTFSVCKEIEQSEYEKIIKQASKENKFITGDENGTPTLIDFSEPTEEEKDNMLIEELESYLYRTDWYVIRFMETGKAIPDEIKLKRQSARDELSELKHQSHQA